MTVSFIIIHYSLFIHTSVAQVLPPLHVMKHTVYRILLISVLLGRSGLVCAQQSVTLYYDQAEQVPKETFEVSAEDSDVLDGAYVGYFTNGSVKTKGQYVSNQATGFWEYFYENGQPKMRGELANNQNAGEWEYFYENGQLEMSGAVYDSLREGPWRFYYENGQLKRQGTFAQGQETGAWLTYYESGARRSRAEYRADTTRYQEFYASGSRKLTGAKVRDQNEGRWQHYYESGELQAEGTYANGVRQGLWKFYYRNGKPSSVGDFLDGSSVGKWTYYYPQRNRERRRGRARRCQGRVLEALSSQRRLQGGDHLQPGRRHLPGVLSGQSPAREGAHRGRGEPR